jgi:hypothetical protein
MHSKFNRFTGIEALTIGFWIRVLLALPIKIPLRGGFDLFRKQSCDAFQIHPFHDFIHPTCKLAAHISRIDPACQQQSAHEERLFFQDI